MSLARYPSFLPVHGVLGTVALGIVLLNRHWLIVKYPVGFHRSWQAQIAPTYLGQQDGKAGSSEHKNSKFRCSGIGR